MWYAQSGRVGFTSVSRRTALAGLMTSPEVLTRSPRVSIFASTQAGRFGKCSYVPVSRILTSTLEAVATICEYPPPSGCRLRPLLSAFPWSSAAQESQHSLPMFYLDSISSQHAELRRPAATAGTAPAPPHPGRRWCRESRAQPRALDGAPGACRTILEGVHSQSVHLDLPPPRPRGDGGQPPRTGSIVLVSASWT